jgi:glycosyltransferase EpsD
MHCEVMFLDGGIGVDMTRFSASHITAQEKIAKRRGLGIKKDAYVVIYIAELIPRKNHAMAIDVMKKIVTNSTDIHLLLVGQDNMNGRIQQLVLDNHLESRVHFLGYRNDIADLCQISNIAITTSKQEGFGVSVMEALAAGLPVVGSRIRGHINIIEFVDLDDVDGMVNKIENIKSGKITPVMNLPKKYWLQNALIFHGDLYEK